MSSQTEYNTKENNLFNTSQDNENDISEKNFDSHEQKNELTGEENNILQNKKISDKHKKRKIRIITLISLLLLIITFIFVLVFILHSPTSEVKSENINSPENKGFFKISSLFFNSSKKEFIKTDLEGLPNKTRRLEENENVKEIKSEYLFTIV